MCHESGDGQSAHIPIIYLEMTEARDVRIVGRSGKKNRLVSLTLLRYHTLKLI